MAKAIPNPDLSANGGAQQLLHDFHEERAGRRFPAPNGAPHVSNLEFWGEENPLASGAEELAAQDPELLKTLGISTAGAAEAAPATDAEILLAENAELRAIIAELKTQLEGTEQAVGLKFEARQKEYDQLLEEKSQIIRDLHLRIQELEARPPVPVTPKEEELLALSEELERERCQLQQDRRALEDERKQLAEDEEIMTQQMREMEVQMARERADFARQRNELNRIQEEIRRELENIERNGLLNQRLGQLRQRSAEVSVSKGSGVYHPASPEQHSESEAPPAEAVNGHQPEPRRRESFLGRLFG